VTEYERGLTRALQLAGIAPRADDFYSPEFQKALLAYFGDHVKHPRFVEWRADHLGPRVAYALRYVVPWVERLTGPLAGKQVLEVGCGTGSSTVAFAAAGAMIFATDIHSPSLDAARLRVIEDGVATHVKFAQTDPLLTQDLPAADIVLCYALLEHMMPAERLACFDRMWTALKTGGCLVVYETPNRFWPFDGHTTKLWLWSWLSPNAALWYGQRRGKFAVNATLETMYREGYGMTYGELIDLLRGKSYQFVGASGRERLPKRLAGKALSLLLRRPRWALTRNLDCVIRKV
jgi:2-polyprenyl-3-methyl-5-hydroxy-6-metoxy-1,4-benzoquinol methylase